jgi:hypothetical protein
MDSTLRLQLTILPPTLVVSQVARADLDKIAFGLLQILVLERNRSAIFPHPERGSYFLTPDMKLIFEIL